MMDGGGGGGGVDPQHQGAHWSVGSTEPPEEHVDEVGRAAASPEDFRDKYNIANPITEPPEGDNSSCSNNSNSNNSSSTTGRANEKQCVTAFRFRFFLFSWLLLSSNSSGCCFAPCVCCCSST